MGVLSLGGWSPQLHAGFHGSDITLVSARLFKISFTGLSPSVAGLSRPFYYLFKSTLLTHNPDYPEALGLGSSAFARHYSRSLV